jgi:hypothetical protein
MDDYRTHERARRRLALHPPQILAVQFDQVERQQHRIGAVALVAITRCLTVIVV